jgi:glutathione S-transferase
LYGFSRTRTARALWALEIVGADYEFVAVDLAKGKGRSPEYLAINPNGKVPTLVDGDLVLSESAAICTYLGERYPDSRLVPAAGSKAKAEYLQWCFFTIGELEQPLWTLAKHKYVLPEERRVPQIIGTAQWEFARAGEVLSKGLADRAYLVGNRFTAADIMVAHTLGWARAAGVPIDHDNLEAYADRQLAHPALARARGREAAA